MSYCWRTMQITLAIGQQGCSKDGHLIFANLIVILMRCNYRPFNERVVASKYSRILIRWYLYSRFGWRTFVSNRCFRISSWRAAVLVFCGRLLFQIATSRLDDWMFPHAIYLSVIESSMSLCSLTPLFFWVFLCLEVWRGEPCERLWNEELLG